MYHLKIRKEAEKDYQKLDKTQQVLVTKGLNKIQALGLEAGQPLKGNLKFCRKIKMRKAGLRIVFKEADGEIEVIEIVVIGKRADSEVYKLAKKRLNQ